MTLCRECTAWERIGVSDFGICRRYDSGNDKPFRQQGNQHCDFGDPRKEAKI